MKKYKLAVVCGRFQPIHKGHISIIDKALGLANKVGLYIGSANNCGTEWNPLSYEDRYNLVYKIYQKEIDSGKLVVAPLNDRPKEIYADDQSWGKYYLACIYKDFGKPDLFVYGNDKVRNQWFTEEDLAGIDTLSINRDKLDISATRLREIILEANLDEFKKWTDERIWDQFLEIRTKILKVQGVK